MLDIGVFLAVIKLALVDQAIVVVCFVVVATVVFEAELVLLRRRRVEQTRLFAVLGVLSRCALSFFRARID